jgi:VIT1/CCC1 family predicted Fe2+/Mn2+ transporter
MSSQHTEHHFTGNATVRDIVIGMSDGLTVPFALAAGLSGVHDVHTVIIVTAGLAEIAAGSIAMGLGGFLAARGEEEHYANELKREYNEVKVVPDKEAEEVAEVFDAYGISRDESMPVVNALRRNPDAWVDFMMKFELGLEKPDPKRAMTSATTIAASYIVGGIIPLLPYILMDDAHKALMYSVAFTLIALLVFGIIKGRFTGVRPIKAGIETMLIGGLAAGAAYGIAKIFT